ncbi:glycoside hydrolase family 5 protein, partial [Sphaerobolus stellatus SS14]
MPRIPSVSPATGKPTPEFFIHTTAGNFVDVHGRTLLLRGVNLSGASKTPVGSQSQVLENFWEDAERGDKNFIGRPLNLDDGSADVHLARLKGWGFNMLRYVVAWEALEHEGPGKYDYEFMDYTVRVLRKCKEYGFKVFMDPHQDIWSRFSGGSGAPYWTLVACGINPRHMTATQSAIVHCEYPTASDPDPGSLPAMLWSTNYGRLAAQTLFTLFFAGRDYAPKCIIDGMNIQDYLEHHYLTAFGLLADRIRDAGDLLDCCVIGWDSMNEPFEGFCGNADLANTETSHNASLKKGSHPTIIQSLRLGMGQKQTVEHWNFSATGPQRDGEVIIDPKGRKLWLDPETELDGVNPRWGWTRGSEWTLGTCVWALHGVWDPESGDFINPYHFQNPPHDPDRLADFIPDYWQPHWQRFAKRIRASHPEAIHFVQPPVFVQPPPLDEEDLRGRACYSGHYYDGLTLVTRHWNWFNADALGLLRGKYKWMWQAVKIGEKDIRKSLQEQLAMLKDDANIIGPYPTLIGEIGTPFDMDDKRSYGYTDDGKYAGDYSNQTKALDASLNAADGPNCINWTVWTYVPDNTHKWGDGWNMEDLSLFSQDDLKSHSRFATVKFSSTLSLATIGRSSHSPSDKPILHPTWNNPLDFLTDGGRAVPAFSRPYPIATVGTPIDLQFDINKARFKLTVRVSSE